MQLMYDKNKMQKHVKNTIEVSNRQDTCELSPLTGHACSTEDQGCSPVACTDRYGPSCCALDPKTQQCGIYEFDTS